MTTAARMPPTPLWGDFEALRVRHLRRFGIPMPQVIVGGTPCQSFSVAGLRQGLADSRGNLTLAFVRFTNAVDNLRRHLGKDGPLVVWENVPGIFSSRDNAFGCFLAGLAGSDRPLVPSRRWTDAGVVAGPRRAVAWRCLDAQYFGLAQRRKRVFVVASPRGGSIHPREILFESQGVRRDTPPRREAGEEVAGTFTARSRAGGGLGSDFEGTGRVVSQALTASVQRHDPTRQTYVAHTLRGDGFDASEDGTGRGTPLVAVADPAQVTSPENHSNPRPELCHTLPKSAAPPLPVAFGCKDVTPSATVNLAPTLRSMPSRKGHDNGGGQLAVAVALRGREGGATAECSELPSALRASQGGADKPHVLDQTLVRRLTPVECERLMGFPDGYTAIPGAADGPRYRALGNSMAVPVVRWIGGRLVGALGGPFTFISVCSGIEAVSAAWAPLGCTPLLYVEIDRFARRLLKQRWGARVVGKVHPS